MEGELRFVEKVVDEFMRVKNEVRVLEKEIRVIELGEGENKENNNE